MTEYTFSATVTSEDNRIAVATQPFTVTGGGGTTAATGIFGATITGATNLTAAIQAWQSPQVVGEPIGCMKIYLQNAQNPPPVSVSAASVHVQAAATLKIPVLLCYEPAATGTTNDATWPGGADKPAQGTYAPGNAGTIQGDLHDMVASVQGLQATGLTILGVCLWQEADNSSNFGTGTNPQTGQPYPIQSVDQYTYLYYQSYATFKSHCPAVPLGQVLTGYGNPYANASPGSSWIAGPTSLLTTATRYTDFFMLDVYGTGYHNFKYTPYQNGPGNAPNPGDAGHLWDIADYMGVAAGWSECGNSASGTDPGQQYMTAYIASNPDLTPYPGDPVNSMQAHFAYRLSKNLSCMPWMWYTQENAAGTGSVGPNGIFQSTDYRVPLLQSLAATLSGGS